jgi:hypothetical protein
MSRMTEPCERCNGRGYVNVRMGGGEDGPEWDGERGCDECCPHTNLELLSGPGVGCSWCGMWFRDRAAAEREVASR